jgi:hypothetical protein
MPATLKSHIRILLLVPVTVALAGCGLAQNTSQTSSAGVPVQANAGEHEGTIPTTASTQPDRRSGASSPERAVEGFAERYINWTYRTLPAVQDQLAASSTGEARAAELQSRQQTLRDTPLARGHIYNTGTIVAVAPARTGTSGEWVIVTREQTGGEGEYAGLPPAFHVTLAAAEHLDGQWVVSAWRPQE